MKNKHNVQRLIGGIVAVVGIVLVIIGATVFQNSQSAGTALVIIGIPFILAGCIWESIALGNSRKFCDKCGKSMSGCAYEYLERNRKRNAQGNLEVNVHFIATCPHCGAKKQFDKKFFLTDKSDNLEFQVDSFVKNKFGH